MMTWYISKNKAFYRECLYGNLYERLKSEDNDSYNEISDMSGKNGCCRSDG